MKKVLNSVLASALALTIAPMVVGAEEKQDKPAVDPKLQQTINRLSALGLIQGYPDGSYGENNPINRAEFATLVVRARGLEEGAKMGQFQSRFTDVKPSDWFAGYVNVASGQEIIKGYENQTFRAGNNVTYAEAVTMLVRALNYEPSVKGLWPNNMIAKAAELGLSKNVPIVADKPATRGDIFQLIDNALTIDLMKQTQYGTDVSFEVLKGHNLLTEYLNVKVYDMKWAKDKNNDANDLPFVDNVPVIGLGTLKANEVSFTGNSLRGTYKVADKINPNQYMGQHVQVWLKDDRKQNTIVWMESSESEEVVTARMDTVLLKGKAQDSSKNLKSKDDVKDLEFKLDNDRTYSFTDKPTITFNYQRYKGDYVKGLQNILDAFGDSYALSVKAILDDKGDISYLDVVDDVTADVSNTLKYGSQVVKSVDVKNNKQKITNLEDGTFDLKDKEEGRDFLVYINGELKKLADVQPKDVYNVYYADGKKEKPIIMISRNVVSGKVDSIVSKNKGDARLNIGGKTYRFREASYSDDANKTVKKINVDKANDLNGMEVNAYLDSAGRIRHVETKDSVKDKRLAAIVTKDVYYDNGKDEYQFKVVTEKGKELSVSLDKKKIVWGFKDKNHDEGKALEPNEITDIFRVIDSNKSLERLHLLEVSLDNNGKPNKVKVMDTSSAKKMSGSTWKNAADEDDLAFKVGRDSYDAAETVVFDMTGKISGDNRHELKDARTASFKNVAKKSDVTVYYMTNDKDLEYVFVVEGKNLGTDADFGWVKSFTKGSNESVTLIVSENGEAKEKEYKLDDDVQNAQDIFNRYDFIRFTLNGDNEIIVDDVIQVVNGAKNKPQDVTVIPESKWDDASIKLLEPARVDKIDGKSIVYKPNKDEAPRRYLTNSKTVYIDADNESIESGVDVGDYIVAVDTDGDGTNLKFVIIVATSDYVDKYDLQKPMDTLFLKQKPAPEEDSPFDGDVTATSSDFIGDNAIYAVKGKLLEKFKGATVTIKLGDQTVKLKASDFSADGLTFRKGITALKGAKEFDLVVELDGKTYEATGTVKK